MASLQESLPCAIFQPRKKSRLYHAHAKLGVFFLCSPRMGARVVIFFAGLFFSVHLSHLISTLKVGKCRCASAPCQLGTASIRSDVVHSLTISLLLSQSIPRQIFDFPLYLTKLTSFVTLPSLY